MKKYSREKAILYAEKYWNYRNPKFFNFDKLGGDCTNFISQCLFYGGFDMDFKENGWFYSTLNSRSPAWSGVNEFCSFSLLFSLLSFLSSFTTTISLLSQNHKNHKDCQTN